MAKIARYDGDLEAFASAALGVERTIFGSLVQSDVLTDNINADYLRGWGIVSPSSPPSKQDFNAMGFTLSQILAYLHQMGVAEWNIAQEYHAGSATVRTGNVYVSKTNTNVGNDPAIDTVNWKRIAAIEDLENAASIKYSNTLSGLTAVQVQAAIDELVNASSIKYSNAISGLIATKVQAAIDELVTRTLPAGAVSYFAMGTAPTGWLQCNGAEISRAAYSALFAAIGTTYGAGDGSLTFNIPDIRGEFLRGWDDGRGVDVGRAIGTVQADALEQHSHYSGVSIQSGERPSYAGAGYTTANTLGKTWHASGAENKTPSGASVTSGVISTGVHIEGEGAFGATTNCKAPSTETRGRNIAMNACIKY